MRQLHMIPDWLHIKESRALAEKWNAAFEYNDFFHMNLVDDEEMLKKRIQAYKEMKRDRSKDTLHGAFLDLCINSQDKKLAELSKFRMRQSMEIAAELHIKGVIFHTNYISGFHIPHYIEAWMESSESFYRQLAKEYDGIEIYMENMFDTSPYTLTEFANRMKDVHNFGVCFDVAHGNVSSTPMEEWFEQLAPYIRHFHINDNDGKADLHLPLGKGCIDWNKYQMLINKYDVQSSVLIEVSSMEAVQESFLYMKERGIYPFYGGRSI